MASELPFAPPPGLISPWCWVSRVVKFHGQEILKLNLV